MLRWLTAGSPTALLSSAILEGLPAGVAVHDRRRRRRRSPGAGSATAAARG